MSETRICWICAVLLAFQLSGCRQTREIDPAVPQSGPLVGTWEYVGDDLVDREAGVVHELVIGDGTWHIPKTLTFRANGTAQNIGYHDCHFWIQDDGHVKLSVGNGNRVHKYQIKDNTLTLSFSGPYTDREDLVFTRVDP